MSQQLSELRGADGGWAAYLVSLPRRHDRRRRLAQLLRGEQHEWLKRRLAWLRAVDGGVPGFAMERLAPKVLTNHHSAEEHRRASLSRFQILDTVGLARNNDWLHMTPGAVGCALSHRAIWEHMLEGSLLGGRTVLKWALVLEDDVMWIADDFQERLSDVLSQLPADWHICYLGWHGQGVLDLALGAPAPTASMRLEACSGQEPLGTFAYLVSTAGAEVMLTGDTVFPLCYQLDVQLNCAIEAGVLKAYRCGAECNLLFSPPCQFLGESNVQVR